MVSGTLTLSRVHCACLCGRLNDETEAHIDRMDELDGRYEGHGMEAGGRTLSGAVALGQG